MSVQYKKIKKEEFAVNEWSGGTTTQLAISPVKATLSERNFDWRISSATFTSTESRFSDFSDYQRYILPLKGEISLMHNEKYNCKLQPYDIDYFFGSWITDSTNSADCRDFNLIVKKEIPCNLIVLNTNQNYIPKRKGTLCLFSLSDFTIDAISKNTENISVNSEELLIITEKESLHRIEIKTANTPVILCEIQAL